MKKNKLFTETFSYKKLAKKNIRESLSEDKHDLRPEDRLKHLKDLYDMEPGDLTPAELKELRDAGMLEEACLKEESSLEAKVASAINILKGIDSNVFYPALLIYEILGIEHPSEELIKAVEEYVDDLDTVYDSYMREEIRAMLDEISNPEAEIKSESSEEIKVEEKLGEFRKGGKLGERKPAEDKKCVNKDFCY